MNERRRSQRPKIAIAAPMICSDIRGDGVVAVSAVRSLAGVTNEFDIYLFSGATDAEIVNMGIDIDAIHHIPVPALLGRHQFDARQDLQKMRLFWMQRECQDSVESWVSTYATVMATTRCSRRVDVFVPIRGSS